MPDILDSVSRNNLAIFLRDFQEMMRVAFGMDKSYGESAKSSKDVDFYMERYDKLIKKFDKKYHKLRLKLKVTDEELKLRIFVDETDVKKVFSDVASRMSGLRSIGATGFGKAEVSDSGRFAKELERVIDKIFISYYDPEGGSNAVYLELDKKQKRVEIHYNSKAIKLGKSPEYKLISYYAVKDFDKNIDLLSDAARFGFTSLLDPDELKDWKDDFDPSMNE